MRLLYVSDKSAKLTNKNGDELELSRGRIFVANSNDFTVEDSFHIGKENFKKLLQRCEVQKSKRDDYENLIDKLNHIAKDASLKIGKRAYITDTNIDAENARDSDGRPFSWEKADADPNYSGWDSMYMSALDAAGTRLSDYGLNPEDYDLSW